jgi:hypothetical protein
MKYFFLFLGLLAIPQTASAARVFFEPEAISIRVGDQAIVDVYVDTQGESINAADLQIAYPPLTEIRSVSRAGSVFSIWIQEPAFSRNSITIRGGVPSGISTSHGRIARFVLQGNAIGTGALNLAAPSVILRNDGEGTPAVLTSGQVAVSVGAYPKGQSSTASPAPAVADSRRPAPFSVAVGSDPDVFGGKRFASFYTTDADSGIDHYEISENGGLFRIAQSPFLIASQGSRTVVRVRAYDAAGNWRESVWPGALRRMWWWISGLLRIS